MRKMILIATLAATALAAAPGLASAQNACEADKHSDKVAGTLFGAIGGAILGDIVAGHGHKGDGALVGAAGGAVVGNQLARSNAPCPTEYGYSYGGDYGYAPRQAVYAPPPPPPQPVYDYRASYTRYDAGDRGYDRGYGRDAYRRDDDGDRYSGYGGYRRACRIETRSYVEPDGDYVTRQVQICR